MFPYFKDDDIFLNTADNLKSFGLFPMSPRFPEDTDMELEATRLPLPFLPQHSRKKLKLEETEVMDFRIKAASPRTPDFADLETSFFEDYESTSNLSSAESEDSGSTYYSSSLTIGVKKEQLTPIIPFFPKQENLFSLQSITPDVKQDRAFTEPLNDILLPNEMYTGFSEVKHRYEGFKTLVTRLISPLRDPVEDHNLTQAQRNHLKKMIIHVQEELQTALVSGVLDERICEWKFNFSLNCPLPMDGVYRQNIDQSTIYFFKDHAKTYVCQISGVKRPYALEMDVYVQNKHGHILPQDVDVKIGLFRVFPGGRTQEVPEFKIENGRRKRCWGMIKGDVLKGKSRICVMNKTNDKSKSTAVQTLRHGRGKLFGRVEIPALPGLHRWVLTPANLSDDIGKAVGSDFVVKSKRTARKRKRGEQL